ncbi:MAG: hypothetical protein V1784_01695 [bacterium]
MTTPGRLEESHIAGYNTLARQFVGELHRALPNMTYAAKLEQTLEIRFAAKNPEVGDLWVVIEPDEITVCIGRYFHSHCWPNRGKGDSQEQAEAVAIKEAIELIRGVFEDKIVMELCYRGTRLVWTSLRPLSRDVWSHEVEIDSAPPWTALFHWLMGRKKTTKCYVWSGPCQPAQQQKRNG